jgi:hypothetical protein
METLNAWILLHRRSEVLGFSKTRLNLASVNLKKLVAIDLKAVKKTYSIADLEKVCGVPHQFSPKEIAAAKQVFGKTDQSRTFRGKFQTYFMRVFLTKLTAAANSALKPWFATRCKVKLIVSDANFLSDLTQYADTPRSLREFILSLDVSPGLPT